MYKLLFTICILLASPAFGHAPHAEDVRPSMADSFRLGRGGDTMCQAQRRGVDDAAPGLFDRSYALVCRDATSSIGRLYAVRGTTNDALGRINAARTFTTDCEKGTPATLTDTGVVQITVCSTLQGVPYDILAVTQGDWLYVAEGLAGYRSALELGLRTLVTDRIVDGPVTIALTEAGDPASFARAQAGSLDPALAMSEGYRRNNSGSYAEASEFFDTLLQRSATQAGKSDRIGEYLVNRALQESDLGNLDEAETLFAQADAALAPDPISIRQRRNYHALDLINRNQPDAALALLRAPLPDNDASPAAGEIDRDTALALNSAMPLANQLNVDRDVALTPAEKVTMLDAQAEALIGRILRIKNQTTDAASALNSAMATLDRIRGGRVASLARLRAQVATDQAALAETEGRLGDAERLLHAACDTIALEYPKSFALDAANARLAGFLARRGRDTEATALYRKVVSAMGAAGGASSGFANLLDPYFALLVRNLPTDPALADDFFIAVQAVIRPGVADTQATLARELSAGSGAAGRLFRQSLNEARQANMMRLEIARLTNVVEPTLADRAAIADDRNQLAAIEDEQSATQAQLTQFPAYRALATQAITLADLRAALRPGEAYWKMTEVGSSIYGLLITDTSFKAWKVPASPADISRSVDRLRDSIAIIRDGQTLTPPFDASAARALYLTLAGPVAADLPQVHHLIVEPDGAMLRLPVALLIDAEPGLDKYLARQRLAGADPFDLRGISWLGRDVDLSVALSARAFRDVRATPASKAKFAYLGFGQNAPVSAFLQLTSYTAPPGPIDCRWPLSSWSHPISDDELVSAAKVVGASNGQIVTGARFTDTDIINRRDMADYRVIHFATHGLVVAPHPQCPAQPALLTSFGAAGSDGLLSFGEIYALHLDADLVILSACDTAGSADVAATRAAGVETGGGNALDGLVRAFIGAGGRSVLASHWPAPDTYAATERLIAALFSAPPGTSIATALRRSQRQLMDDPATSQPYYWAGFALIGDGAQPVLRSR